MLMLDFLLGCLQRNDESREEFRSVLFSNELATQTTVDILSGHSVNASLTMG